MTDVRRSLPSVGKLLEKAEVQLLLNEYPRTVVVSAIRDVLDAARNAGGDLAESLIGEAVRERIALTVLPTLRPVVNATGVVLHTNLGRAPLAEAALDAIRDTASGYSNLEYDLEAGTRGSRYTHCVELLKDLTGAEDAIVVNNCAAALILSLATLAAGRDAIVSRGELVEIGGSFRIPDIMRASGANLLEVGTTNRTHADDYIRAAGPDTGAFVKVHRSNFTVSGFVAEVGIDRLAPIANERGIPVIHDLGSGLLIPLDTVGLSGEPLASDAVRAGATLVLMSGDKLVGGPQAGIIIGRAAAISRLKAHPLARALRVDKLTVAALSATLQLYREPALAMREIPILAMLSQDTAALEARAAAICARLAKAGIPSAVVNSTATVGAGAFPGSELHSYAISFDQHPENLEAVLRSGPKPVVGRVHDGRLLLDMRSVMPAEDSLLSDMILRAMQ